MKFDKDKSSLEITIERAIDILSRTYPEQIHDAMTDYVKVLSMIRPYKDWRVFNIIDKLERLYVYPNRSEHNSMINEVHELKEELHEERVQKSFLKKRQEPPVKVLQGWQESISRKNVLIGIVILSVIVLAWKLKHGTTY